MNFRKIILFAVISFVLAVLLVSCGERKCGDYPAKDCIIATAKKDDLELIAVILGAEDTNGSLVPKFLDCKKLFLGNLNIS